MKSILNRIKSYTTDFMNNNQPVHKINGIYLCDNARLKVYLEEPDTIKWVKSFNKDDIFFDVGANIGAYSLISPCKTYAFEPAIFVYGVLLKNIIKNDLMMRITPINMALGENQEIAISHKAPPRLGAWGVTHRTTAPFKYAVPVHNIMSMGVDDFVKKYQITPTHMKIDTDGAEQTILKSAKRTIPKLKSLVLEVNMGETVDIPMEFKFKCPVLGYPPLDKPSGYNHFYERRNNDISRFKG